MKRGLLYSFLTVLFISIFVLLFALQNKNEPELLPPESREESPFSRFYQKETPTKEDISGEQTLKEVAQTDERLCADTQYILEEVDLLHDTCVTTEWSLPPKYIGMNRENFLLAMQQYEMCPPLIEAERGFQNLSVLSFSRERVVVRMNYRYVEPGESFYLAVYQGEVVVYLEDKETIYLYTGIMAQLLPQEVLLPILSMQYIENEDALYSFLESYSS